MKPFYIKCRDLTTEQMFKVFELAKKHFAVDEVPEVCGGAEDHRTWEYFGIHLCRQDTIFHNKLGEKLYAGEEVTYEELFLEEQDMKELNPVEAMQALIDGKELQYFDDITQQWEDHSYLSISSEGRYRLKPEPTYENGYYGVNFNHDLYHTIVLHHYNGLWYGIGNADPIDPKDFRIIGKIDLDNL